MQLLIGEKATSINCSFLWELPSTSAWYWHLHWTLAWLVCSEAVVRLMSWYLSMPSGCSAQNQVTYFGFYFWGQKRKETIQFCFLTCTSLRNLHIPIRSQIWPSHTTQGHCLLYKIEWPTQPYWPIRSEFYSSAPVSAHAPIASQTEKTARSHQTLFPPFEGTRLGNNYFVHI